MFRYSRLALVITVCLVATLAYSKAGKIKVLSAAGAGVAANPDVRGTIIMNYHDSNGQYGSVTEIQLAVKDLEPDTVYGVQVWPGVTDRFAFTSNASGNGHWHSFVTFDITPYNPEVRIFVDDGSTYSMDWTHISFTELRAIGCLAEDCTVGEPCTTAADCDDDVYCSIDTCDGGFCFHAPIDCGENNYCSFTHYSCDTRCVGYCTTDGDRGCCNTFDACPGPYPGPCPCAGGYCGCEEAPCP